METLRNDNVHTPDSISSLSCINTNDINELSKEKEEELLYGTGDDGDEEDALSDDSIRLRLSDDDEIESENVLTVGLDNQENKSKSGKSEIRSEKHEDVQLSSAPENDIVKNNITVKEIQREDCSGNVSINENLVTDHTKDIKINENRPIRSQVLHMPHRQNYEPQWRFMNSVNARSFRGVNHFPYRYRYLTPRGHYRLQSHDYNNRFNHTFPLFEQGRGSGKFNSFNKSMYNNRQQKRGFKPSVTKKSNGSTEYQNFASSSNTNTSKIEVDNDIIVISENVNKATEKDNILNSECSIINENNDDKSHELLNRKVESTVSDDVVSEESQADTNCINDFPELQHKIKVSEENSLSNHVECNDVSVTEASAPSNTSNEKSVSSHDSNKQRDKINISSTIDKNVYISDNSKEVEILSVDVKSTSSEIKITSCIEKNNIDNQHEDETIKTTTDTDTKEIEDIENICASEKNEVNTDDQLSTVNQSTELSESSDKGVSNNLEEELIVNNEVIINEEVTNDKVEETFKTQEDVQNTNSNENENNENNVIDTTDTTVINDLTNEKTNNEIRIIQNDLSVEPGKDETCHNDQLNTNNSTNLTEVVAFKNQLTHSDDHDLQEQNVNVTQDNEKCKEKENENSPTTATNSTIKLSDIIESVLDRNNLFNVKSQDESLGFATGVRDNSDNSDKRTDEVSANTQRRRKRTKKMNLAVQEASTEEDKQVKESGRQKRQTAKHAEEIIREKFLNRDSDLESSDDSEKFVTVNHKMSQDMCPLSPPSLKRSYSDIDSTTMNGTVKKVKINSTELSDELATKEDNSQNVKNLNYVHKFFQRDLKEKLPKLKQEELEELLIQKIVETITMRGEIGKLREQARISERNQEATRAKCQQLAKQIKDFEMVLNRNAADRRANNDKPVPPIKINRSVGLQVNFVTDHGMQNLRQLQQNSSMKALQIPNNGNAPNIPNNETNNAVSPRRGIKVRSPRRTDSINAQTPVVSQNHTQSSNIMPTITPAALVVAKSVDTQHNLPLPNQSNVQQIISNSPVQQQQQQQQTQQTIVLNGKLPNQINRQGPAVANTQTRTNDLIDLTDEEEKSKAASAPVSTTTISEPQISLAQSCFQRVIQTIPGNVAITNQPPSIRVVQPASQPTPTALVNNMNAPRLTYVMQSGVGPTRQLLITPNSSPMRPVTSCNRPPFSTLTYKTGISTVANGSVRVLTTPAPSNVQLNKHPAPLPDTRNYVTNPHWKLPPPAPSLKISKVANGIVLSWNMNLSDKYADIASYQLYAYQEIAGIPPNTSLWKKVGDVRALPLPMACTLTQFSEGNNYYFAVRAVDTHSRKGQYSIPSNISL